ncbi:Paraquat-inducible protein B [compost metagenome]
MHTGSRFWNTSGIGVEAGLFKGVKVRSESLETLIAGGVAFATPELEQMGTQARPGQTFALFDEPQDEWLLWAPRIALPE